MSAPSQPPTTPTKKPKSLTGFVIAMILTLAMIFMGEFIPLSLRPLDYLGMPYPSVFRHAHVTIPLLAFGLWLACNRSLVVGVLAFVVAWSAMTMVAQWASRQPVTIPVTRMLDSDESEAMEKKVGFRIWETADRDGAKLVVDRTPGRAEQVTNEVKRLGIWRP